MTQYIRNWIAYLKGFFKLGQVVYKPGWRPITFLGPYLTTYAVAVALGFGVVSVSRVCAGTGLGRLIDWFFEKVLRQGPNHCANTGGWLWGTRSVWK
jgi:hypothetical protein